MAVFKSTYSPSWLDRLIRWIDRMPIPNWLVYAIGYAGIALLGHIAMWIDRVAPVGSLRPEFLYGAVWSVLPLMFLHHLTVVAGRAADRFAPLLRDRPEELAALRYRMTTMPAWPIALITSGTVALVVVQMAADPSAGGYEGMSNPASYAITGVVLAFSYSVPPALVFHGIRLLDSVTKAYRLVEEADMFQPRPLYAFSGLTLQASLFWVLLANLSFIDLANDVSRGGDVTRTVVEVAPFLVLALLTFLVPLLGIHRRLREQKLVALDENGGHARTAQRGLYAALAQRDHAEVEGLDRGLAALYRAREELRKLPTWPWTPGTFRTFLSAVSVPMIVWTLQQLAAGVW